MSKTTNMTKKDSFNLFPYIAGWVVIAIITPRGPIQLILIMLTLIHLALSMGMSEQKKETKKGENKS